MTTDPIEVMTRAISECQDTNFDSGCLGCEGVEKRCSCRNPIDFELYPKRATSSQMASSAINALTASGYIIMTVTERDGIRAAAMAEAAEKACEWYGNYSPDDRENLRMTILSLATAPAGFACVPVEPNDAMIKAGVDYALNAHISSENPWQKHIVGLYRAMTASKEG